MSNWTIALIGLISVISLGLSLYAVLRAERPLLQAALIELADLREAVEKLLVRNHARARAENAEGARKVKEEKRSLVEEAQALLAEKPTGRLVQSVPAVPVGIDAQVDHYRRKAGLVP